MSASLTVIINTTRQHSDHNNASEFFHKGGVGGGGRVSLNASLGQQTNAALWEDDMGEYEEKGQPLYAQVIIVLMYVLIIIVAVGGNLLFSYIIVMRAKMPSVTNLFLLNLAISDLMKAIICNPFTFMANLIWMYWPYGDFMCPVVTYIQVMTVFLSAFTLVAMSVDRYVAILRPMRPKMSRRAFITIMTTIWILSSSVSLPTALTSKVILKGGYFDSSSDTSNGSSSSYGKSSVNDSEHVSSYNGVSLRNSWNNSTKSININISGSSSSITDVEEEFPPAWNDGKGLCLEVFENAQHRYIYSVVIMMLQYFVPLAVITVTNSHIGYIVWIKKTPGEAEADRDRRMAASKRRLVKMIIIVVVIYAVCWLPLHVITVVGDHNPDIYNLPHMNVVWLCAHWLAMSHSCYNPIVYFSLNTTFRRNLKRMMLICRNSVRRHYRNRKRRGGRGYNSSDNNTGSASSLQHNGGLNTNAGDWTICDGIDEEETEFVKNYSVYRNETTRGSRFSNSVRSGTGSGYIIRAGVVSNSDWKNMAGMSRKNKMQDIYM